MNPSIAHSTDQAERLRRVARSVQERTRFAPNKLAIAGVAPGIGVSTLTRHLSEGFNATGRPAELLANLRRGEEYECLLKLERDVSAVIDFGVKQPPSELLPLLDWLVIAARPTSQHLLAAYAVFKQISRVTALPKLAFLTVQCEPSALMASRDLRQRLVASARKFLSLEVQDLGCVPRFPANVATDASRWRPFVRSVIQGVEKGKQPH
jgi:hypothetical protein